jgi:hypothetical protein
MRKSLKQKRKSCKMCKPHKMGWDVRWKPRELATRRLVEGQIRARVFDT